MKFFISLMCFIFCSTAIKAQVANRAAAPFEKVILSPHIDLELVNGEQEKIEIIDLAVPEEELITEVKNGTLKIYLKDAKTFTKHVKEGHGRNKKTEPVYNVRMAQVRITYRQLDELTVKGEETVVCSGILQSENFKLKMYGEAALVIEEARIYDLKAKLYGANELMVKAGQIDNQILKTYGESNLNLKNIINYNTKIIAYGESSFYIQTRDRIKVITVGESKVYYSGSAKVNEGIMLGGSEVKKNQ